MPTAPNLDRIQVIIHRRMQQRFNQHREKIDKHRKKGPAFAAAVEELEQKLFPEN